MQDICAFVYFIHEESAEPTSFKVGKTSLHPGDRREQLQTGNPRKLIIYRWIETPSHSAVEEFIHKELVAKHIRGEWFHATRDDIDVVTAIALSMFQGTASSDYPQWTEEDLIAQQKRRVAGGKYRGASSPRTARRKKKEYWDSKPPVGFSDD